MSGRTCGDCNLCCKVVAVESIAKPANSWCRHAKPGKGCSIYDARPELCRVFLCGWLETPEIGDEWKPNQCKMVLRAELDGQRLCVDVDPTYPDAWRKPLFYNQIKLFSRSIWQREGHVVVYVGRRVFAIFPEEDLDVGNFDPGEDLFCGYAMVGPYRFPFARLKRADGSGHEVRGGRYLGRPS